LLELIRSRAQPGLLCDLRVILLLLSGTPNPPRPVLRRATVRLEQLRLQVVNVKKVQALRA
jgi:hypothetical protein